jgi:DNA-binding MarR family transcriptional regulator
MTKTSDIAKEIAVIMPRVARRILLKFFQSIEISQTQLFSIIAIQEIGTCRMTDLSKALHISKPTVSGIVDRLVKGGYVQRFRDNNDRRVIHLALTHKGRSIAFKLRKIIKNRWENILEGLPKHDQENYLRIMRKIQGLV